MMELKACPRCYGDMRVSNDLYGDYKQCLQCGNTVELKTTTRRRLFPTTRIETEEFGRDSDLDEPLSDLALLDG
jgi:hypothetical protein